jgi:hypothetical protein
MVQTVEATGTEQTPWIWLPLSGGGVAVLARGRIGTLWRTQLLVAVTAAAVAGFFVWTSWFPVIATSFAGWPDVVRVEQGELNWSKPEAKNLAENGFLSLSVEVDSPLVMGQTADVQITGRRFAVILEGLFGSIQVPYPASLRFETGRVVGTAWWGAYSWVVLLAGLIAIIVWLIAIWWVLSTAYAPVAVIWLVLLKRRPTLGLAWRLAAAGLLFGSLWMSVCLLLYATHVIQMPGLIAGFGLHLLVGWIWMLWGAACIPIDSPASTNPFAPKKSKVTPVSKSGRGASDPRGSSSNPFQK